ncbi:M23 family metallopeptidase [Xylanimonas ulmi]|uniref:Peptidase M23-like protein n=1 Tax=Xylanimonas ulmi TaxID=228973 RepID=A0A4Q7M766_9MICO|nr:M23 family metallopeptidase [Xylanibacterium ulmi]RZS61949.1 peptidase M23-like protein [Xylanibacterium ulmi]
MTTVRGTTATADRARDRLRRRVARHGVWWLRAFVAWVAWGATAGAPWWAFLPLAGSLLAGSLVRPRWDRDREPVVVAAPVRGTWVALNSPGSAVPSHGVRAYGQTYAIDILVPADLEPVDAPHATASIGWLAGARPQTFPAFGKPVYAMADGVVVAARTRLRDHRARNTWLGLAYLLVEGFVRELGGVGFVVGNHLVVDHGDGVWALYAHLRRGGTRVRVGERVTTGQVLGEVGNSGNTSEPHLHAQLMDRRAPTAAQGVPLRWTGVVVRDDVVAPRYGRARVGDGQPGLPANGQVFEATLAAPTA